PRPPAGYPPRTEHALVRSSARLLRLRDLGRADDQLRAPAADAREPARGNPPAPEPCADLGEPGDHPDLRGTARRRPPLDLAGLRHVPTPDRPFQLRHLDLELPDARLGGRGPDAPVLDLPRRRRFPARVPRR